MVDNNDDQVNAAPVELQKRLIAARCEKGHTGLVEVIKNTGGDVNVTDAYGRTVLMFAVYYAARCKAMERPKLIVAISWLLYHGANADLVDTCGQIAFDYALKLLQKDIIKMLFNHGAKFPSSIH
jgi:ankyrin repeat protein